MTLMSPLLKAPSAVMTWMIKEHHGGLKMLIMLEVQSALRKSSTTRKSWCQ